MNCIGFICFFSNSYIKLEFYLALDAFDDFYYVVKVKLCR
ncbi:unnamed protein product [Brassica oleracea var. botrytis]|uniref:(rape) hypothetical protein n=1 Tax=Brassica napus TaxID=3708 RepID=A0A816IFC4_BRANA|nr:unnamed protein product [Brassica napus]